MSTLLSTRSHADQQEKIFAGEFDDVGSDDEGEGSGIADFKDDSSASDQESDLNIDDDDDDGYEGPGEGDNDCYDDTYELDNEREAKTASDPYAGVFFSKDRIEAIIEPVEEEKFIELETKGGLTIGKQRIRVISRGEWMSGCPEEGEQSHLFQLYHLLEEPIPCPSKCGHVFTRSPDQFLLLFTSFNAYCEYLKSTVRPTCTFCSRAVCLVCGNPVRSDGATLSRAFKTEGKAARINYGQTEHGELLHCPPMQGLLIGVGLHIIERAFTSPQPPTYGIMLNVRKRKNACDASDEKKNRMGSMLSPDPEPSDHSEKPHSISAGGTSKGIGYAGERQGNSTGQIAAIAAQEVADKAIAQLLSELRVYLPTLDRAGGVKESDVMVHPTALAHLRRRSGFVTDLLRSDSLLDMSGRRGLYQTLFEWLEVVSAHESLASMLAMPQMRPTSFEQNPDDTQQMIVTYVGSASPRELLESCAIQATVALRSLTSIGAKTNEEMTQAPDVSLENDVGRAEVEKLEDGIPEENRQLLEFCKGILKSAESIDRSLVETKGSAFVTRMRDGLPRIPEAGNIVEEHSAIVNDLPATIKLYEDWAHRARFQYCDMSLPVEDSEGGTVNYLHAFNNEIQTINGLDLPKRSLAIAKELAILTRSLPVAWSSSIFLRVDEARVDCIKAMITGPEGTPYENGCFVFDVFLPLDYNQSPPSVKSMTTNGGKYRYNPNLYPDGKVCLSLLGTWSGPGWVAGQSTLLQVLISIQSLILCEEPYLNEPGWAHHGGSPNSKAYSANVRRMVVTDAMANNIKTPPKPFENEIRSHFRLKAKHIREQLDRWKALDDGRILCGDNIGGVVQKTSGGSSSQTSFDKAASTLRQFLDELEGNES